MLKQILKNLPKSPGIYEFLNKKGKIIYIGKSINLFNRVNSYFNSKTKLNFAKKKMVSEITDIKTIIVNNEKESLILETNLIKKHKPKYNILMKDDKNYIYIKIANQIIPKIIKTRIKNNNGNYFGPYISTNNVNNILKLIKKIFGYRSCNIDFTLENNILKIKNTRSTKIPCIDFYTKRCCAPCLLKTENIKNYENSIENIKNFLNGNYKNIIKELNEKMLKSAKELKFEEANNYKKYIESIKILEENQIVREAVKGDFDIINYLEKYDKFYVGLAVIRNSKIIDLKNYEIETKLEESIDEILSEFIKREINLEGKQTIILPKEILNPLFPSLIKETTENQKDNREKPHLAKENHKNVTPSINKTTQLSPHPIKEIPTFTKENSQLTPSFTKEKFKPILPFIKDNSQLFSPHIKEISQLIHPHIKGTSQLIHPHIKGTSQLIPPYIKGTSQLIPPYIKGARGILKTKDKKTFSLSPKIEIPKIGPKLDLLKFVYKNIYEFAYRKHINSLSTKSFTKKTMKSLLDKLGYNQINKNIIFECNDISHLSGSHSVASRSVIENGKKNKSKYRKFNIKTLEELKIDDFSSMKEIMERRLKELKEKGNYPDLIIIDGGKGQLNSVLKIIEDYKKLFSLSPIQLVSIAKKEEELFLPGEKESIKLSKNSKELKLIQELRDEAHRFAITFNREKRIKSQKRNILESIPGIGAKTRAKIIKNYGNIDNLKNIEKKELNKIISKKQIEALENHGLI